MISPSDSHRARLFLLLGLAARSAPMTGINRFTLSRRTLLFLLVLLGTPPLARSDTLEDSAKELARKVAAALPGQDNVSLGMQNSSSLNPEEVARVEQILKSELRNRGIATPAKGFAGAMVAVTLSESFKNFVLTAQIHAFDADEVVLTAIPRPLEHRVSSDSTRISLHSEKFWEGPQHVLDAAIVAEPNGVNLLLLLTPDALLIRNVDSDQAVSILFPPAAMPSREPVGFLTQSEDTVIATIGSQICNFSTFSRALLECHPRPVDPPPTGRLFENLAALAQPGPARVDRGAQIAAVPSGCGIDRQYLAAGQGDYTEPDTILLFESELTQGVVAEKALADVLRFPGPVMSIQSGGAPPRAIVRNLLTGNYEAYQISISCGQ
jgi:hypothetical protein